MSEAFRQAETIALFAGSHLAVAKSARAAAFCTIPCIRDGFVALRAALNPQAKRLGCMQKSDQTMIAESETSDGIWGEYYRGQNRREKDVAKMFGKGRAPGALIGDECRSRARTFKT